MSQIMEKFDVLNKLNAEFKQIVKILYVFQDYDILGFPKGYNVFIVTKSDKTYAFDRNPYNQLVFEHKRVVNEIQNVEELCYQQIIDFANGWGHFIALNSSGKVYCWGRNYSGLLGIGPQDMSYHKPKLNQYLNKKFVIDISCGGGHSLVLTNCGEVYAWGWNGRGQIGNGCYRFQLTPIKVKGCYNERVVMISCGECHSMVLTECGRVYSWGRNDYGQLGIGNTVDSNEPKFVAVNDENKCNVFIEKISCGSFHSLLLSSDGYIYAFGRNSDGELGNQKEENNGYIHAFIRNIFGEKVLSPHRIKVETKFIDISSHWNKFISIALSQDGIYYIWGQCGEEIIRTPKPTYFESFVDIYAEYFKITPKAINFEEENSDPILLQNSAQIPGSVPILLQDKYAKEFSELSLISFGTYGFVSKVMQKNSKEIYAVKKIPLNQKEYEKVSKELNIMEKLKSCYVVELIDSWIEENSLKMVEIIKTHSTSGISYSHPIFDPNKTFLLHIQMEFCCQTLNEVIEYLFNELSENAQQMIKSLCYFICSELLVEIIQCVNYLHGRNIIHRDLKPANILITDGINGRFVKLADFGISVIHEYIDQTHTQCSGTPKYMAPEVFTSRKYDTKADIYSIGKIVEDLFFSRDS
jgi:alpha-tubulin suppressor-like RCC1 family protein/tRNA A-37 threonylcarbamoyl transferase component Bud32